MMMEPIYVTGAGIVSALGAGKEATMASLKSERSGVGQMKYLPSRHTELPVGEVPMSNEEMMARLGIDSDPLLSRTVLMGRLALQEALQQACLEREALERVHLVSATTVGCMDRREEHYAQEADCDQQMARIAIENCGSSTEMIAAPFGDFASLSTVSTACSSATNAFMTGADMLRCGMGDIAVVGGSECLSLFHLNGFNSLMNVAHDVCRPFDQNRQGLNLGEGAAYLVIETATSAARRGVRPLCQLSGYGNRCDAHHQTASSPDGEGAYLAMNAALAMAGLEPSQIDYVNAHGTGTQNNDESETRALLRVFGAALPPVSSTKAFTGHTTSASGSIEAVICVLALQHQFLPVNYNWSTPIEGGFQPVTENIAGAKLCHVMSNAFGFGGNDSSMILSGIDPEALKARFQVSMAKPSFKFQSPETPQPIETSQTQKKIYLRAAEQISMQQPLSEEWMTEPRRCEEPFVRAVDPAFREYIAPNEARRMATIIKRALTTSLKVLRATDVEHPDAIITGTCYGCLDYTDRFLADMVANGEQQMSPTHFMQSTHNTIGSAIGISTRSHGYNTTYSHGSASFALAVQDAWMQMQQGRIRTALVGAHDELFESFHRLMQKAGLAGREGMVPSSETSMSMLLDTTPHTGDLCELCGIWIGHHPSLPAMQQALDQLLHDAGLTLADVDAVMMGENGDPANDVHYSQWAEALLPHAARLQYKPLFGENMSASALGLYAASHCLAKGTIPACLCPEMEDQKASVAPKCILCVNQMQGYDYSFILLKKASC